MRFTGRSFLARSFMVTALGLFPCALASANPVLEFDPSSPQYYFAGGETAAGWSFTTNQAITVTALDAYDAPGSANDVRLYDASGTTLASATVSDTDPTEGSPVAFHTVAITPLSLAAHTTYFIASDTIDTTTLVYAMATGLSVDPAITYGGAVGNTTGAGGNPMTDGGYNGAFNPGFFGPNFDIGSPVPLPSSAAMGMAVLAGLGLLRFARRTRTTSVA